MYIKSYDMPFGCLNIYSKTKDIVQGVLKPTNYIKKFSQDEYNVYLENEFNDFDNTYRSKQMRKGIYLGHNIGLPCNIKISDKNIYVYSDEFSKEDYKKVFWNFIIKFILTEASIKKHAIHFKGTLIKSPNGKLIVLLGRGGSGKTTIANELINYNYKLLSNTHCIYKEGYIWGIDSWLRIRNHDSTEHYLLNPFQNNTIEGTLDKLVIVEYNNLGNYFEKEINKNEFSNYFKFFSSAIINYDLKEEIFDYCSNDIFDFIKILNEEDEIISNIYKSSIKFLSVDVRSQNSLNKLLSTLCE